MHASVIFQLHGLWEEGSPESWLKISLTNNAALKELCKNQCLRRAATIIKDSCHLGNQIYTLLPSGRWYRSMRTRTTRFLNSFHLSAVKVINTSNIQLWILYMLLGRLAINLNCCSYLHCICLILLLMLVMFYCLCLYVYGHRDHMIYLYYLSRFKFCCHVFRFFFRFPGYFLVMFFPLSL